MKFYGEKKALYDRLSHQQHTKEDICALIAYRNRLINFTKHRDNKATNLINRFYSRP